jgi:hypothetical protein
MRSLVGFRLSAMLLFASMLAVQACGGDDDGGGGGTGNQSTAGDGDGGGGEPGGVGGTKNNPGNGGEPSTMPMAGAGAGGEGTDPPVAVPLKPRTGSAVVVDGVVATSQNFRVILTLGEGPSGNTTMKSAKHRVNLGVIGSTQ